jgi:geranylgeranyl diphosphate synthase, type I
MTTPVISARPDETFVPRVEAVLAAVLDRHHEAATDLASRKMVVAAKEFTFRGGKRLRPLFCHWGWRGAGRGGDEADVLAVAAAIELFHTAALVHDDLIDNSDRRRGRPTMHRMLEALHRDEGWRGDSAEFGRSAALLVGDGCLIWSEELFHSCTLGPDPDRARSVFGRLRAEVVHGEGLDLIGEARGCSIDEARDIARYKTAGYTVRHPLHLGGLLAGADEKLLTAYDGFGLLIGEAFQLRDDLVGCFGNPAVTGKSIVDDARQGKPTVLIAVARALAGARQRGRIDAIYGSGQITEGEAAELRDLLESVGARAAVEQMIGSARKGALERLHGTGIEPDARIALEALASAALDRDT